MAYWSLVSYLLSSCSCDLLASWSLVLFLTSCPPVLKTPHQANSFFKSLPASDQRTLLSKNMTEMCHLRGALRYHLNLTLYTLVP